MIRGIWKSSIRVLTVVGGWCGAPRRSAGERRRDEAASEAAYFEYSSTMSCSCTGAAISARSGLRSTFAVSWS